MLPKKCSDLDPSLLAFLVTWSTGGAGSFPGSNSDSGRLRHCSDEAPRALSGQISSQAFRGVACHTMVWLGVAKALGHAH